MNEPSHERADPSARSLGSLFCNIHFVSNSIKLRQLYVTEFATDENQFFQPIKYELGKVLCMFLCLSRCVFHWGFLRPTLEFRFFIFFFRFFISAVSSLISIIMSDDESIFPNQSISQINSDERSRTDMSRTLSENTSKLCLPEY